VRRLAWLVLLACVAAVPMALSPAVSGAAPSRTPPGQRILPPGAIKQVMVIDLENESFGAIFGDPSSYISQTLAPQGEIVQNYYATGHVSLDNYVAQVSGQAPNFVTNSDCIGSTGAGAYNDGTLGALDANQTTYPGQVDGQGCVYPAAVQTIGGQLDAAYPSKTNRNWRVYAEDMGNDPARDGGTADPLGGTDCAHPQQTAGVGIDNTNSASAVDQYATRHNPFLYFHSVTDNTGTCNNNVVPLGTVTVGTNGAADSFSGHLAQDLATPATTPRFSFVSPNLCNDGHDATCVGTNTEGTHTGGLTAANLWLKHWMPLILNSPAYQSGHMLVVLTADEGNITDTHAGDNETAGPNNANPGYSPVLNTPVAAFGNRTFYQLLGVTGLTPNVPPAAGTMPGGGQTGALLLNPVYVHTGTVDTTGSYNHYSALRSYEDLLGLDTGGSDGQGHLGFAATATPFGPDIFTKPAS
jgi:phosphatidylinositol-3-phosphatase